MEEQEAAELQAAQIEYESESESQSELEQEEENLENLQFLEEMKNQKV